MLHSYIKQILTVSFLVSTVHSQEVFVNTDVLSLAQITNSYKYCKHIKNKSTLCQSKELSYIDYDDPDLPSFLYGLKNNLEPMVKTYAKSDLKSSTLSDIAEYNADISGEWYDNSVVELFAKTPNTYTLVTNSRGYSGGAHGYYAVRFDNYSIATQKKLTLDDVLLPDYNTTLTHIAELHYKRTHTLQPQESLQDDGWFENTFVLPENIAITTEGLYLYYNSYEIKPYADGHTQFLLPYSQFYKLIDPQGALGFAVENKQNFHAVFYEEEKASITFDTHINPDKTITLTATISNLSFLEKGWFSLSFPQLQTAHSLVKKSYKGFETLKLYPKGSKVYHRKYKKAVSSRYLLVEAEASHWKYKKENSMTLLLKLPPQQKELIVDIHATIKSKNKTITIPDELEGIEGQQGYDNYRMFIGL